MSNASVTPASEPAAGTTPAGVVMSHRQILFIIFGLMSGMFLASLDQTIVGTAIRTISDDLHGLSEQAWVTTAYLITSTISTPILGKLSDIFGRRPVFLSAIVIFLVGSLLSGTAWSMYSLAAFRAVQGIGAGGLMSLALTVMGDILAPRERAKYQGYFLAVFGTSSVIGPLVGGLFAGADQILWITGWRWVFLVNLPIGVVSLFMVTRFLHLPKRHGSAVIDWWGASAVILALVPGLIVAEQGRDWGWGSPASIACYVLSVIGVIGFLLAELRMGENALIPLRLFRNGTFAMSTVLGVLVGFGMFGALLTIPLYLQIVQGVTPTQSGFLMLPMVLGMMTASIASGQLIARTGRYKIFPITGTAILLAAFFYFTFITAGRPIWWPMIGMFGVGLGLGQLMQTLTIASQNSVDIRYMGVATSSSTFFRQIGGTVGTAVLLSVLFSTIPTSITSAMQDKATLTSALDAALNPAVASAPQNRPIMHQIWDKITTPVKSNVDAGLGTATTELKSAVKTGVTQKVTAGVKQAVTAQVTAAVAAEVKAGALPAAAQASVVKQQVAAALPTALQQVPTQVDKALPTATSAALATAASKAHATVVNGRLTVDWSNAADRRYYVDKVVPTIRAKLAKGSTAGTAGGAFDGDTSFLTKADRALKEPFLVGFSNGMVTVFWVGLVVVAIAFLLSWFLKATPLRAKSALQEAADRAHEGGAMVAPGGAEQELPDGAGRPSDLAGARARTAEPGAAGAVG